MAATTGREQPRGRQGDGRNAKIGSAGEQAAARYLTERGYRVLDRNWHSPDPCVRGELDLVVKRRRTLVICEVKTRTGTRLAHPAEAVTWEKAARLRRLAAVWLRERGGTAGRGRGAGPGPWGTRSWLPWGATRSASAFVPTEVRIDVVAVRLGPREPHPVLAIDHLQAVA